MPGGDQAILARDLAQAAEFISHATGLIADMRPAEEVDAPLTEARALAAGDLAAEARVRSNRDARRAGLAGGGRERENEGLGRRDVQNSAREDELIRYDDLLSRAGQRSAG